MNPFQPARRIPVSRLLATDEPDLERQADRIRFMERNFGLPVKLVVVGMLFYVLFFLNWFEDVTSIVGVPEPGTAQHESVQRLALLNKADIISLPTAQVALEAVRGFFLVYVVLNIAAASMLLGMSQLSLRLIRWVVFVVALLDAVMLAALTMLTGGYDSFLFWVFLGLIVRNAVSIPAATLQIGLNLAVSLCYVLAGVLFHQISELDRQTQDPDVLAVIQQQIPSAGAEMFVLRLALLWLMTACCYGVQVLVDKQRRAEEESREFEVRQEQLRSAGRLAAEIAHQLKNPLGIINNAAFTLKRTVKEGRGTITQQIQIIREEVERSDRILTELMGYAQLTEGKVERLSVTEELDRAMAQVFPPGAQYDVEIHRDYAPALPLLLIQRNHLSEIFTNLLQNAREAMQGRGRIDLSATYAENYSVMVTVADTGPGIPEELRDKIFEAYFTSKEKGTGLGLAIVKHNAEMYGGSVRVESEIGKGTCFTLVFPARTLMKIRK